MKIVHETTIQGQHPIRLLQRASGLFDVHYGFHTQGVRLSQAEAAKEYGHCVMHALQCSGLIEDYTG